MMIYLIKCAAIAMMLICWFANKLALAEIAERDLPHGEVVVTLNDLSLNTLCVISYNTANGEFIINNHPTDKETEEAHKKIIESNYYNKEDQFNSSTANFNDCEIVSVNNTRAFLLRKNIYYRNCDPLTKYKLIRHDGDCGEASKLRKDFAPNRQNTFAIYGGSGGKYFVGKNKRLSNRKFITFGNGMLVDLKSKDLCNIFCGEYLHNIFAWSPDGNWLAYQIASDIDESPPFSIKVKDIVHNKTVFQETLDKGRRINSILWEPQGSNMVVLSYTYRLGMMPWELIGALVGHGAPYYTWYLDVFSEKGERIYSTVLVKDLLETQANAAWVPEVLADSARQSDQQ